ncbi:PUR family DNA/RNA-binding protein [Chitinophagales bacterium]|nr:PUR family DNA/RNA-binding protein [Chitinophagales bacterium]
MEGDYDNEEIYSKRVRAGRRRTYFFDIRQTKGSDYFLTVTESKRRFDDDGYERHKLHLYKEDINKFVEALEDTVKHLKTQLLPDYDFDSFKKNEEQEQNEEQAQNDE